MLLSKKKQNKAYYLKYVIPVSELGRFQLVAELKTFGISVEKYSDLDTDCLRNILTCVVNRICDKYKL